jgi:hypothetical protein
MHLRRTTALTTLVLAMLAPVPGLAAPSEGAADWGWSQGTTYRTLHTAPRSEIATVPSVGSVPAGAGWPAALFYSWVTNEDVGSAGPNTMMMRSIDGGTTFGPAQATESSFYALTRLSDGDILDVAFLPRSIAADRRTVSMRVTRSSDNGVTWTPQTSTFVLPYAVTASFDRGLRVNPNVLVDANGWLYISYYTRFEGDSGNRAEIAVSKDEGVTWQRQGPIITSSTTQQYNEVGLSWTPSGDMMAVVTQDEVGTFSWRHTIKLITARSTNKGAQWGSYRVLPITRDPGFDYRPDPSGVVRYGILPDLELLQNGAMVLRYGRPDNWFAISTDGGQSFRQARRTFVNFPHSTVSGAAPFPYHGSSGNGTIAVTGPNTVVISFDKCAAVYGCNPDNGETAYNVNPAYDYAVYMRTITVSPPS